LRQKEPQLTLAIDAGHDTPNIDPRRLRKLQKDLRDLLDLLSKPATSRRTVHPIRAPRSTSNARRATERLFDTPAGPEGTKHSK
jgi:hypothetical protein